MATSTETTGSDTHAPEGGGHTLYIVIAIVLAIVFALFLPNVARHFHVGGEVFLRMLTMMVVPLVMMSVMSGILGLGDVRKLGKPGGYAILYYMCTTVLAVIVGLVVVNVIQPGKSVSKDQLQASASASKEAKEAAEKDQKMKAAKEKLATAQENFDKVQKSYTADRKALRANPNDEALAEKVQAEKVELAKAQAALAMASAEKEELGEEEGLGKIFNNLLLMLFTENLIHAAATTQLLPLIVFSIIFAGMLTTLGSRVDTITTIINQANDALMSFVMLLMKVAPIGIFCLVTSRFGEAQAEGTLVAMFQQTGKYILTVLAGLGIHALITLPLIYWIFTRKNPYVFIYQMSQAILTAFSTASSSATLPVTMECATEKAGISQRSSEFVLPLGATINMDGTALYEAAAAIFIAQAMGDAFDLTFAKQVIIAVTATLAAIGAAGIPEAGLVTMLIVLNAVGLPVEYVGLILSVDWLLDRFRTAVNAFGDSVGAAIVDQSFPKEDPAAVATKAAPEPA